MTNKTNTIGEIKGVIQKTQGNQKYLFGTIKSDKVKNVTFVPVDELSPRKTPLNENTKKGYQRPGSLARMRAFSRFLKDHPNSIIPPILLSGRGNWHFKPNGEGQEVGKLIIQGKAAILDGQHRLGGFVHLYESEDDVREISFILLHDLDPEEEKKKFLVINNTQKGVPKSLTIYLEGTEAAQVAWGLNEEADSPFNGKIAKTNLQRTQLFNLASVAKQVKELFSIGGVQDIDVGQKIDFMSRFWTIIADQLHDEWIDIKKLDDPDIKGSRRNAFEYKLLELTGLIAWARTGAHIFSRSYSEEIGMNWDNVRRLVEAASVINWRKDGDYSGMTGEYGGKIMANDMIRLLPAESAEAGLQQALS